MTPYKRFKLRAHDHGIDRHNKGTAYLRKQERLRQEREAVQPQRKSPRRPAVKFGSNVIRVDFSLRTRIDPEVAEQLRALAKEARRSTRAVSPRRITLQPSDRIPVAALTDSQAGAEVLSTHDMAQDAAARWGSKLQAL